MGVTVTELDLKTAGAELTSRIDQELYLAKARFKQFIKDFGETKPLGTLIHDIRNGVDVKQQFYSDETNTGILYLSVNQIVGGHGKAIDLSDATYLDLNPEEIELKVEPRDVVITRSGTPGMAWMATEEFLTKWDAVVPSGYTQRIKVNENLVKPEFLAAYLNMPPVRMLTRAFACGKDQPNIGQEYVKSVPVPDIPDNEQLEFVKIQDDLYKKVEEAQRLATYLLDLRAHAGVEFLRGRDLDIALPKKLWEHSDISKVSEVDDRWRLPRRRESD